jgi:hypothetical protein
MRAAFLIVSRATFKYRTRITELMKKTVLAIIFLATVMSVYAANGQPIFDLGKIQPNEYTFASCERQLPFSTARQRELYCWVDSDESGRWTPEERVLGTGINVAGIKLFTFDTESQKWWMNWRTKQPPCNGQWAYLAGREYDKLFEFHQCARDTKIGTYWCCPDTAFSVRELKLKPAPSTPMPGPKAVQGVAPKSTNSNQLTGALLVLNKHKWAALKKGHFENQYYEQRAIYHEYYRCLNGGQDVRIIDPKYGSYFSDTRNIKEGERAFFLTPDKVITLISKCDF